VIEGDFKPKQKLSAGVSLLNRRTDCMYYMAGISMAKLGQAGLIWMERLDIVKRRMLPQTFAHNEVEKCRPAELKCNPDRFKRIV
jgi:hypothetical protein